MASWGSSREESSDDMPDPDHLLLHRIQAIEETLKKMSAEVVDIDKALAGVDVRLDNGRKVFAEQKRRIEVVEDAVAPKPVSVAKIVSITIAVIALAGGALWGLSEKLSDRPTIEQIERIVDRHDDGGHLHLRENVTEIETGQKALMERFGSVEEKLDRVLEPAGQARKR